MATDGEGLREVASAARFDFPGIWTILKCHGNVRCFSRNSLVFVISSRVRSPNIFTKGLWSVTTSKLSHPCVKKRVCSKPHATARASPSIGAYLDSAPERKREPARTMRHPSSQQSGMPEGQLHCFWRKSTRCRLSTNPV